eukprot:g9172.t1
MQDAKGWAARQSIPRDMLQHITPLAALLRANDERFARDSRRSPPKKTSGVEKWRFALAHPPKVELCVKGDLLRGDVLACSIAFRGSFSPSKK